MLDWRHRPRRVQPVEIFKEYRFEAAHRLPNVPADHPCSRLHGHSYRVILRLSGPLDPQLAWVRDFGEIDAAFLPLRQQLDHHCLNDIPGLENSTCENLTLWLCERLRNELPELSEIEVYETADAGCRLRVE